MTNQIAIGHYITVGQFEDYPHYIYRMGADMAAVPEATFASACRGNLFPRLMARVAADVAEELGIKGRRDLGLVARMAHEDDSGEGELEVWSVHLPHDDRVVAYIAMRALDLV